MALRAQVKQFSADISANVGFNNLTGIDGNKHTEFGFTGGANVLRQLAVVGEFNYLPQGSVTQSGVNVSADYQLYGFAVRYSPLPDHRIVPFISLGEGYARLGASAGCPGCASARASLNGSYFGLGGGGSIYITPSWGLRPEFRWDRQTYYQNGNTASQNDVRGMIAVFYQWGGRSNSGASKVSSSRSN